MWISLHAIARLGILALAASSLAALTAAQMRPEETPTETTPNPWLAVASRTGGMELVHRQDGRTRRIEAPRSERWDYIATSPWASRDGSMEAVARYVALGEGAGPAGEGAVGLVRLRLPAGDVLERIDSEVLPTGRAAWDPAVGGRVVFPGATGRLYSYDFGTTGRAPGVAAIEWRNSAPGTSDPFVIDPSWPRLPGPRTFLIVSLSPSDGRLPAGTLRSVAPWWLELDEQGEAIVAAGPLFAQGELADLAPGTRVRHPSVVERDGRYHLLYLRHEPTTGSAAVYASELDLDPATGRPSVRPGTTAPVADRATALVPLIPSLDNQIASAQDGTNRALIVLLAGLSPR